MEKIEIENLINKRKQKIKRKTQIYLSDPATLPASPPVGGCQCHHAGLAGQAPQPHAFEPATDARAPWVSCLPSVGVTSAWDRCTRIFVHLSPLWNLAWAG